MAIRVVRLGSPRAAQEGLRLGTVRRPPRGVPKSEFALLRRVDLLGGVGRDEPLLMQKCKE